MFTTVSHLYVIPSNFDYNPMLGWNVNFNVSVSSFEGNICGVRNLVDFALKSMRTNPPRLQFISSIGVLQSTALCFFQNYEIRFIFVRLDYAGSSAAMEEVIEDPDVASGIGYSESKWVSERILQKCSEVSPLSVTVIRCGQMTGGPSGAWNEHEWFPSLIKSSAAIGKLPAVEGVSLTTTFFNPFHDRVDFRTSRGFPRMMPPARLSMRFMLTNRFFTSFTRIL